MGGNEKIRVRRDDQLVTLVLDSGGKLNALDRETWVQLRHAVDTVGADETIRCVVVRGAGHEAFAAGADITEFETVRADAKSAKQYGDLVTETVLALANCPHPTLALIEGVCIGGGLEIAAACDLRICGSSSRFGIPINRLGLVVGYPELELLIDIVGRSVALELLYEGGILDAQTALEKRLVNRVVADAEVKDEAYGTAARIAAGAPLVAHWHKKFARRLRDPAPLMGAELDEAYDCYDTEDYRTGRLAFLNKTRPRFTGR